MDPESLKNNASDETEDLYYPPEVVLKPRTAEEISQNAWMEHRLTVPLHPFHRWL